MDTLFKTIDQVREFVTVDISSNFKTINPYLAEAHKWVLKGIDKETFTSLVEYVNAESPTSDEDLDALLPFVQRTLANFAYGIATKRLGIYVGENGMMEFQNSNLTPLVSERLEQVQKEFFSSGYNALEMQIVFIQENADTYADSYAYLFDNAFFVSTANEFNGIIHTEILNRDYFDMKSDIYLIEFDIRGIITEDTFNTLKEDIKNGTLDDDQETMLTYIKPAECLLAYGQKFKSEKHTLKGKEILESLRNFYATLTDTTLERWDNEDKRVYVFGG